MEELLEIAVLGDMDVNDIADALLIGELETPRRNKRIRAEQYGRLNLDELTPEEIQLYFRFNRRQLLELTEALRIPNEIRTDNGHVTTSKPSAAVFSIVINFFLIIRFGRIVHMSTTISQCRISHYANYAQA
uniref:Uncharacterized protein n=1 Tax=Photinus pyralis TaxID=7054 RepID=A0A1Y1MMH7_PHOPY